MSVWEFLSLNGEVHKIKISSFFLLDIFFIKMLHKIYLKEKKKTEYKETSSILISKLYKFDSQYI